MQLVNKIFEGNAQKYNNINLILQTPTLHTMLIMNTIKVILNTIDSRIIINENSKNVTIF